MRFRKRNSTSGALRVHQAGWGRCRVPCARNVLALMNEHSDDKHGARPVATPGGCPSRAGDQKASAKMMIRVNGTLSLRLSATFLVGIAFTVRVGAQSVGVSPTHEHGSVGGQVLMIARDLEVRLAVNALPKDLRDGA